MQERMMKLIGTIVAMLVGLSLLGALGYGGYLTVRELRTLFATLDPQVASVTAIACAAALIGAWVIARGITAASRRSRVTALREEKTATYQLLLDFWTNRLQQSTPLTAQLSPDFAGKLQVLDRLLALYSGASVIRAHTTLRRLERDHGPRHPAVRAQLGEMLVAIRQDLGTDTPRHLAGDLQQLLVPAVDEDARLRTALA
jgi:hypothetical protein